MKRHQIIPFFQRLLVLALLLVLGFKSIQPAEAAATLVISPITWDVIGLDSNDVNVGPNRFPVGARVCNESGSATTATVTYNWDDGLNKFSGDPYINLRPGTQEQTTLSLAGGQCKDAYFEVQVTRDPNAYNHTRRYTISASDASGTVSTPAPRELFIERLISQSRNATTDVQLSTDNSTFTSIAAGGTLNLLVGQTYYIKLVGSTATQGYDQIESFVNLPNTIFQVLSVSTTYTADTAPEIDSPSDQLYGDACNWEGDLNAPNYRSCLGVGKLGGDITVTYEVKILSVPGAPLVNPEPLNILVYDFSGSSFHYNSDYTVNTRFANILDESNIKINKLFIPDTIVANGVSQLTLSIPNPTSSSISGVNFADVFPSGMTIANTTTSTTGCGSPTLAAPWNAGTVSSGASSFGFSNGTIAGGATCVIKVNVTTSAAASYTNTTNNLFLYGSTPGTGTDTGNSASAVLKVLDSALPKPPTACVTPTQLALWNFSNSTASTATNSGPFNPASTASGLTGVQATYGASATSASGIANNTTFPTGWDRPDVQIPADSASWGIRGGWAGSNVVPTGASTPYFQFAVGNASAYGNLGIQMDYNMTGNWSNGDNWYLLYSKDGTTWTQLSAAAWNKQNGWKTGAGGIFGYTGNTGDSTMYFRVIPSGAQNVSATLYLDNIKITGCQRPNPPAVTKSFSPAAVAVGDTSTLTITITNPNTNVSDILTGIRLDDYLPVDALQGTVTTDGTTAVVGTGTAFKSQLAAGSIVYIPATVANLSGTVAVTQGSRTVTGTGTSFTTQLAVGGILSIDSVNYTVSAIASNTSLTLARPYRGPTASGITARSSSGTTYTVSSITDDTHLTLTTGAAAGSDQAISAGLTLTGAPSTTCTTSSVTGAAGQRAISLAGNTMTGTAAVTTGSPTVTGTGTAFTTDLAVGSTVYINSVAYQVAAITSNTSLTLTTSYAGASASGLSIHTDSTNLTGSVAVTQASTTVTGTGTSFTTQLAVGNVVTIAGQRYSVAAIGSPTTLTLSSYYTGATASGLTMTRMAGLAGGSSCTITAAVKASAFGTRNNLSGLVAANESGENTTASGYAAASLTAYTRPVISKFFAPSPVRTNGVSVLTFVVQNPNPAPMTGVAFSDTLPTTPGSMVIAASPNASTTGCGSPTFNPTAGAGSISFSGGTIAGGSACTVKVNVTAPAVGDYNNTSGSVSGSIGTVSLTGNTASAALTTVAPNPKISLMKQVGASESGPWYDTLTVTAGAQVYYRFTAENIGDVDLSSLALSDPDVSCTNWVPATLPVGTATVEPYSTCVSPAVSALSGVHANTASVTGSYGGGSVTSNTDTATYKTSALTLVKHVTETYYAGAGNIVHYSYLVTNSGYASLRSPVTIADDRSGDETCPAVSTVGDLDDWLEPNESITCTATYTITADDVTAGSVTNSANATADGVTSTTDTETINLQNANFGHLPSAYTNMNLFGDGGARHLTGSTYLGASVPVEGDGINAAGFTADPTYDNGVAITTGKVWKVGTPATNGGSVNVTVACPSSPCYLAAWIDWGNDGSFSGSDNIIAQPVNNGTTTITFSIPGAAEGTTVNGTYYARFRLYAQQPASVQPNGEALTGGAATVGEVEDYRWEINATTTPVTLSYFRAQRQGSEVAFTWSTSSETANVGFNLFVEKDGQIVQVNPELVPSQAVDSLEQLDYSWRAVVDGNIFFIEDVSIHGETRQHGPFHLGQEYGGQLADDKIDQAAVRQENADLHAARQNELKKDLKLPAEALQPAENGTGAEMQLSSTLNLKVRRSGIYRVSYEALRDAGLDLAGVPATKITLTNRGQVVPVYVSGSGKFGPGGYIEFYGQALDTLYTDTNVYTLQVSRAPAARISSTSALPGSGLVPPAAYQETLVVNNQRAFSNYAPGADTWYDTSMMAYTTPKSWSFTFNIDNLAGSADAYLDLVIWGVTNFPQSPDHHLLLSVNGAQLADTLFDGLVEQTLSITVPAGLLREGANTLLLTLPGDTGVKYDVVNLDRFSLTYARRFQAKDGKIQFTGAGKVFQVANLPEKNIVVYQISGSQITRLDRAKVQPAGGSFTASFVGANQPAEYVVSTASALYTPELEAVRLAADLDRPAQYLVIAHPNFIAGLQPLIEAREAQGLTASVVDVNDLYARYSAGIYDPQAIRDYIAYAAQNLGTQYVLLVGGDSYDYRNYLGRGSLSFIPSLYVTTSPVAKFVPVDPLYTDLDGNLVPDLAIGRFPVRTAAELEMMIQKTLAYSAKDYGQTAVFVSDKTDKSVSFKAISDSMAASLPEGWSQESVHLDDLGVAAARTQLLDAMNRGVSLVNFTGHSSGGIWTFSNLFTTVDAAKLSNAGRPFVVVQWGCWNTYAVDPINNYLVQRFLFSGDRGAAAVLGASTLTEINSERQLGSLLIPRMTAPGMTIGQALQDAKFELAQTQPELLDVLLGWTLMGDPALVIEPER